MFPQENTDILISGGFSRGKRGAKVADLIATVGCGLNSTQEANARLIAAAPDMLGALKAAWAWFNDEHRDDHAWSLVQAAIAKAEGKE
jgi:hypothetical protein